jgi:hypothetical protein
MSWHKQEIHWLHGDMKDMAYFYTHLLFEKLVDEEELK